MNQALHLLKKDLYALRLPLMLLYVLLLAQVVVALQDPLSADLVLVMTPARALLQLLILLSMLVTVGLLVHQDLLVGTTAFWLTRPIYRGSLLKAKLLFLTVFIAGPCAAATLAVASTFGLGPADLPTALAFFALPLLALLTVAVLLAGVTASLAVYMMTWIGLLFASHLVVAVVSLAAGGDSFAVSSASRDLVWTLALATLAGLLVIYQYLTRRTRRTLIGIGVAFVMAVAISQLWRWEIVEWSNPLFEQSPVSLHLTPGDQSDAFYASRPSDDEMSVTALATVTGHPSYSFTVQGGRGEIRFPDRPAVTVAVAETPTPLSRVIVGLEELGWLNERKPPSSPLVDMRTRGTATFDELVGRTGTLQADFYGQAYRHELVGKMPLDAGARLEKGPMAAVIRELSQTDAELRVVLRHRHMQTTFRDPQFPRVVLVNDARGEMALIDGTGWRHFQPSGVFYWGPLVVSREETFVFPLRSPEGEPLAAERDWLVDAELAILEWRSQGRYKTSVRLADFRIRDAAAEDQALSSSAGRD